MIDDTDQAEAEALDPERFWHALGNPSSRILWCVRFVAEGIRRRAAHGKTVDKIICRAIRNDIDVTCWMYLGADFPDVRDFLVSVIVPTLRDPLPAASDVWAGAKLNCPALGPMLDRVGQLDEDIFMGD